MNHLGTKTIETERLIIRQFKIDDAKDMFNNWASDCDVTKYLTWPAHKNIDVSKAYIEAVIDKYGEVIINKNPDASLIEHEKRSSHGNL